MSARHWYAVLALWLVYAACAAAPGARRVVSLTWEGTEQLLELGLAPVGAADVGGYRNWVARPALPAQVVDVGSRSEPNIEIIEQLHPDLIVISPMLAALRGQLERIAPVASLDGYRNDHDNVQAARRDFLHLAHRVGRQAQAARRLAMLDQRLAQLRGDLLRHYHGAPPAVTVMRFSSAAVAYIYGANSMPVHALRMLGLQSGHAGPPGGWGYSQVRIVDLAPLPGRVLYMPPFYQADQLYPSRLWRALPMVREHRFTAMRTTWSYGGICSIQYLAEAIAEAMYTLDHQQGNHQ